MDIAIIFDFLILFGSIQGFILASLLWLHKKFHKNANRFLAIALFSFSLNNVWYIFLGRSHSNTFLFLQWLPLNLAFLIPVCFYFYIIYLIHSNYKFSKKDWILFLPFLLHFLFQLILFFFWLFGPPKSIILKKADTVLFYGGEIGAILMSLIFLTISIVKLKRYEKIMLSTQSNLNKHSLDWLYKLLLSLLFIIVLWMVPYLLEPFFKLDPRFTHYPLWILIAVFNYWIGYAAYSKDEVFKAASSTERIESSKHKVSTYSKALFDNLVQDLVDQKLFKDPDLDLSFLAKKHGVSVGHLSRVINHYYQNSFYHLVNYYRVEEIKKMLSDSKYNHLSILGIAYECGFNSKSTFNTVFKQLTGLTPSAYKKSSVK